MNNKIKPTVYEIIKDKNKPKKKKIPIKRGCNNERCFCTGRCEEIIGYKEEWEPIKFIKNDKIDI